MSCAFYKDAEFSGLKLINFIKIGQPQLNLVDCKFSVNF